MHLRNFIRYHKLITSDPIITLSPESNSWDELPFTPSGIGSGIPVVWRYTSTFRVPSTWKTDVMNVILPRYITYGI